MDEQTTNEPEAGDRLLRLMLGLRVAGAALYTEDGEMQDCSCWPHIDFLRDSPVAIHQKLQQRAFAKERL